MSKRAEEAALKRFPNFSAENMDDVMFARYHFRQGYEQAEKDINKELMDMIADVREKQEKAMYADYDIHIDTSNVSDTSLAYVFTGDKVIDLLTWEDMQKIHEIICGIDAELKSLPYGLGFQEYWEEVLRRFNKSREEKK